MATEQKGGTPDKVAAQTTFTSDSLAQAAYLLGDNPVLIVEWRTRRILACNDATNRVFGYSAAELVGETTRPLHVDDAAFAAFGKDSEAHIAEGWSSYYCRYRMCRRDGNVFPTENLVQVVHDMTDGPVCVVSVVRDLTNVRAPDSQVPSHVNRLEATVPGAIFQRVREPDGTVQFTYIAGRLLEECQIDPETARTNPSIIFDLIDQNDRHSLEHAHAVSAASMSGIDMVLRLRPSAETVRWLRLISQPHQRPDGNTIWDGLALDVTREKYAEEQAHWLATRDNLTGLSNREQFATHLERALAAAAAHDEAVAVAQLGVRGMSGINEAHGFAAGDRVLQELAERLGRLLPEEDIVARSHGDIFLVILRVAEDHGDLSGAVRALSRVCEKPFEMADGTTVQADVTLGVARFPEDGGSAEELIRAVELAWRRAHDKPDVEYDFYAPEIGETLRHRFELEHTLRTAIANDELEPYFQPQISLEDGSLIGFEALIRWPQSDGQWVSPGEFIPIAEEAGLIGQLGRIMLRQATQKIQQWRIDGLRVPPIAVNCSAKQFYKDRVIDDYHEEVMGRGLDPAYVSLEVTEGTLLDDFEAAKRVMKSLTNFSVKFAIDDFGTGFSSLGYLTQLPFSTIKVDRQFVATCSTDQRQLSIVRALVQMAQELDMSILAEGIETREQEKSVRQTGCWMGQGYLYSAALPATQAVKWLSYED